MCLRLNFSLLTNLKWLQTYIKHLISYQNQDRVVIKDSILLIERKYLEFSTYNVQEPWDTRMSGAGPAGTDGTTENSSWYWLCRVFFLQEQNTSRPTDSPAASSSIWSEQALSWSSHMHIPENTTKSSTYQPWVIKLKQLLLWDLWDNLFKSTISSWLLPSTVLNPEHCERDTAVFFLTRL